MHKQTSHDNQSSYIQRKEMSVLQTVYRIYTYISKTKKLKEIDDDLFFHAVRNDNIQIITVDIKYVHSVQSVGQSMRPSVNQSMHQSISRSMSQSTS